MLDKLGGGSLLLKTYLLNICLLKIYLKTYLLDICLLKIYLLNKEENNGVKVRRNEAPFENIFVKYLFVENISAQQVCGKNQEARRNSAEKSVYGYNIEKTRQGFSGKTPRGVGFFFTTFS